MRKIYVDADACPVRQEIFEVAKDLGDPVVLVSSVDHMTRRSHPSHAQEVYVDKGSDSADFKIVSLMEKGDVLVTQDYGLASLVLHKGRVFHHNGREYLPEKMDDLLLRRHLSAQARQAGQRTKGPRKFTHEDRQRFKSRFYDSLCQEPKLSPKS